jgi:hypothetical protein
MEPALLIFSGLRYFVLTSRLLAVLDALIHHSPHGAGSVDTSAALPLPITKGSSVAVVGPLALATTTLISDYEGGCQEAVDPRTLPSIASAIAAINTGGVTNALAGIDVNSASTCVVRDRDERPFRFCNGGEASATYPP